MESSHPWGSWSLLTIIYIIHPFLGSITLTVPPHHGWDTIMGKLFTLPFRQLFHTVLLGMTWGYSWPQQRKTCIMKALPRIVCILILLRHECQHFQSILWTMVSHYQHLLYKELRHVNLLMGHVGYRWTTSLQILLRRNRSICQRAPCYRTGQDNKQLKTCTFLFSAFHILCQDVNGVTNLLLQSGYASGFASHRFTLSLPNVTIGSE